MSKIRNFKFKGGPFAGWEGEFVDNGQDRITYGPPGEKVYVYLRRNPFVRRTKFVTFKYHAGLTKIEMLEQGYSLEQADMAGDGPQRQEASFSQKVEVKPHDGRWVMIVDGVIVGERSQDEITDKADAKAWVAEVMLPDKEAAA